MPSNLITAKFVEKVSDPGTYPDGEGLELRVSPKGAKRWVMVIRFEGKRPEVGLGSYPAVSLLEARESARLIREAKARGIHPKDALERSNAKVTKSSVKDFAWCADAYIKIKRAEWSGVKQEPQWRSSLENYAYPFIGHIPVDQIQYDHIVQMLTPIWHEVPETATRVRSRTEAILAWARHKKLRTGDNPATWKNNLEFDFPEKEKIAPTEHHAAMDYREVPIFMRELRERDCLGARALEWTVLSLGRNMEVCGGREEEIDGDLWIVPPERMKNRKEHRVPLTPRMLEILKDLPVMDGFLFPGRKGGLSNNTLRKYLQEDMRYPDCTPHGFRSTFKDWAVEETNFPESISEAQLAHKIKNQTQAAYERGDKLRKRRLLMMEWENYCYSKTPAQVVPFKKTA